MQACGLLIIIARLPNQPLRHLSVDAEKYILIKNGAN
jgi:hypothetical protein